MSNVRKVTNELSHLDCRGIKQANTHARRALGCPLSLLVTYQPYPGSIPTPEEQARDLNRLQTYLRTFAARRGFRWVAIWVWHSRPNGRSPHAHLFMHCPKQHHDALRQHLEAIYNQAGAIDAREGSDIRKLHQPSGFYGSTLDYLTRFKSQKAYWGDRSTPRATISDDGGRRRGVKAPILGKQWGCTRNISQRAIDAYWVEGNARRLPGNTGQKRREVV